MPRRRQTPLLLLLLLLSAVATRVRGLSSPPLSSLIRSLSPELLRFFPSCQGPGKCSLAHANASGKWGSGDFLNPDLLVKLSPRLLLRPLFLMM